MTRICAMETEFAEQNAADLRIAHLLTGASLITIAIAAFGIYVLAVYSVQRRTKEKSFFYANFTVRTARQSSSCWLRVLYPGSRSGAVIGLRLLIGAFKNTCQASSNVRRSV